MIYLYLCMCFSLILLTIVHS